MGATRGTRAVGGGLRVRVATRPETHRGARPVSRTPTGPRSVCSCYLHLRHTATHLLLSCSTPMHGILPSPRLHHPRHPNLEWHPAPQAMRPYPARSEAAALLHRRAIHHPLPIQQSAPFLDSHDTTTSIPLLLICIAHIRTHTRAPLQHPTTSPAPLPPVCHYSGIFQSGRANSCSPPT